MSSNINFANAPASFAPQEVSTPQQKQSRTRKGAPSQPQSGSESLGGWLTDVGYDLDAGGLGVQRAGLESGILASTCIEPLGNKNAAQFKEQPSHPKRPHYERGLDSGIVDSARIPPLEGASGSPNPTWTETVSGAGSAVGSAVSSAAATVTGLISIMVKYPE